MVGNEIVFFFGHFQSSISWQSVIFIGDIRYEDFSVKAQMKWTIERFQWDFH